MLTAFFKFFFNLLLVAALLTGVFYQFISVPEGHVTFVKQRTLGWQDEPLQPGVHHLWLGFVPTYYQYYLVDLKPPAQQIEFKKGLQYTDYLDLSDVFRVRLRLRLSYSYSPEAALGLLKNVEEDVSKWPRLIQERVKIQLEKKFYEFYQSDRDIATLKIKFSQYLQQQKEKPGFFQDWQAIFEADSINLEKWQLLEIYVPDTEIYLSQVRDIGQVFSAHRQALVSKIGSQASVYEKKLFDKAELHKATSFSELIKENEKVLDYLAIEKLNKNARVILAPSKSLPAVANRVIQSEATEKTDEETESDQSVAPLSR